MSKQDDIKIAIGGAIVAVMIVYFILGLVWAVFWAFVIGLAIFLWTKHK